MTEDTSPENLRKFLESDDLALVRMGLSMAKGSGVPDDLLGLITGLYMWHDDKTVRAAAKSTFMKLAPDELKDILKETWKTSYRTIKTEEALQPKVEAMLPAFKDTPLGTMDVWKPALVRTTGDRVSIIRIIGGFGSDGAGLLIQVLGDEALRYDREFSQDAHLNITSCMQALIMIGETAVEPLINALENENASVRCHAAKALGEIAVCSCLPWEESFRVPLRAVESLIKVLDDEKFVRGTGTVSGEAAEALGKIGDTRAIDPLIEVLESGRGNKISAAESLGMIGDARAVNPLIKALEGKDVRFRMHAAGALGDIGDTRAVPPLIKAIKNWDRDLEHATWALRKIAEANLQGEEKESIMKFLESDGKDWF